VKLGREVQLETMLAFGARDALDDDVKRLLVRGIPTRHPDTAVRPGSRSARRRTGPAAIGGQCGLPARQRQGPGCTQRAIAPRHQLCFGLHRRCALPRTSLSSSGGGSSARRPLQAAVEGPPCLCRRRDQAQSPAWRRACIRLRRASWQSLSASAAQRVGGPLHANSG